MKDYSNQRFNDRNFLDFNFDPSYLKNISNEWNEDEKAILDGMVAKVMLRIHQPFTSIKKIYCYN